MRLRKYQIDVIKALEASKKLRSCVVQHMGTGKTTEIAEFVRKTGKQTLWIAQRYELLDQAAQVVPEHVELMTVQSLMRAKALPECELFVWDECHHTKAVEWQRIVTEMYSGTRLVGMTATPERPDGKPLGDIFEELIVSLQPSEFIRKRTIVPTRAVIPDLRQKRSIVMRVAEAVRKFGGYGTVLAFVSSVAEAERVVSELGAGAAMVCADTPVGERAKIMESFRLGLTHVLVNVAIATEGFDAPGVGVVVLGRNFSHPSSYIQAAGRGDRRVPGKECCILIDLADNVRRFGSPDEDRVYSLDGRAIRLASGAPIGGAHPRRDLKVTGGTLVDYSTGEEFVQRPWSFVAPKPSKASRERVLEAERKADEVEKARQKARRATPEFKAQKKAWYEANRERKKALDKSRQATPEFKARHRAREKARYARPEYKARKRALERARQATPEFKAYMKAWQSTPERKARKRALEKARRENKKLEREKNGGNAA